MNQSLSISKRCCTETAAASWGVWRVLGVAAALLSLSLVGCSEESAADPSSAGSGGARAAGSGPVASAGAFAGGGAAGAAGAAIGGSATGGAAAGAGGSASSGGTEAGGAGTNAGGTRAGGGAGGGAGAAGRAVFLAVGYAARRAVSFDGKSWINEKTEGTAGHNDYLLRGSCIGKGMLVAVGGSDKGRIMISRNDGVDWTTTMEDQFFSDCAFGNGVFVLGGGNHPAVYSDDAVIWKTIPGVNGLGGRRVFFANGVFLGGGDAGIEVWSKDGVSWSKTNGGLGGGVNYFAFGAGRFVAVGSSGRRAMSMDGQTWSNGTAASDNLSDVAFGFDQFLSSGSSGLSVSADGLSWQARAVNTAPSRMAYGAGVLVGTSNGWFVWSADGTKFEKATGGTASGGIEEISFGEL